MLSSRTCLFLPPACGFSGQTCKLKTSTSKLYVKSRVRCKSFSKDAPSPDAVQHLQQGKMVLLVDKEEEAGSLITSASSVSREALRFLIRVSTTLACVPMRGTDLTRLGIEDLTAVTIGEGTPLEVLYNTVSALGSLTVEGKLFSKKWDISANFALMHSPLVFPVRCDGEKGDVVEWKGDVKVSPTRVVGSAALDLVSLAGLPPVAVMYEVVELPWFRKSYPQIHVMSLGQL